MNVYFQIRKLRSFWVLRRTTTGVNRHNGILLESKYLVGGVNDFCTILPNAPITDLSQFFVDYRRGSNFCARSSKKSVPIFCSRRGIQKSIIKFWVEAVHRIKTIFRVNENNPTVSFFTEAFIQKLRRAIGVLKSCYWDDYP